MKTILIIAVFILFSCGNAIHTTGQIEKPEVNAETRDTVYVDKPIIDPQILKELAKLSEHLNSLEKSADVNFTVLVNTINEQREIGKQVKELAKKTDFLSLRIQDYVNDTNWIDITLTSFKDSIRYITHKTFINVINSDCHIYNLLPDAKYKLRIVVSSLVHSLIKVYEDTILILPLEGGIRIKNEDTLDYTGGAYYEVLIMDPDMNIVYIDQIPIFFIESGKEDEVRWESDVVLPLGTYIYSYVLYAGAYFPLQGHAGYFTITRYIE